MIEKYESKKKIISNIDFHHKGSFLGQKKMNEKKKNCGCFWDDLVSACPEGETIEKVVIGRFGWYGDNPRVESTKDVQGKVLSADEAKPLLSYNYYRGYGSPDCHAVYCWTKNRVIFVSQYDGATSVCSVPRFPVECEPDMPGG